MLHRCDCILLPSHVVPPLQVLVRVLVPPLQVSLHTDQVVHEVQEALDPTPEDVFPCLILNGIPRLHYHVFFKLTHRTIFEDVILKKKSNWFIMIVFNVVIAEHVII